MSSATIVLVNQRTEIQRLIPFVEQFGGRHHLSDDEVLDINLVLDEIVINVMVHGLCGLDDANEHEIHVGLALDDDVLTIQVEDDGRPFDLLQQAPPELDVPIEQRRIGGLGIHIVRALTDTIEHRRIEDRNIVTLKRKIRAPRAGG